MATKNIVPNADTEGQLGTSTKGWGKIFLGGAAANIDVNNVSGTNTAGKSLTLISGASTGSGAGGSIVFQTAAAGGSGTSVNSHATVLTLDSAKLATFAGAVQLNSTLTVGVNDTGYDVKFFGATSGKSLLWDESADSLIVTGTTDLIGTTNLDIVDIDGAVNMATTALVTGVLTTTAATVFNGGFASNAASTITTTGDSPQLVLTSTDAGASASPAIDLYRNSSSPIDDDALGQINYYGENDNNEKIQYGRIRSSIADASDGQEAMNFDIQTMVAGSMVGRMNILETETIFNENSADLDFRVESDNLTNAFFVQGSDGNVGIGTSTFGATYDKLAVAGGINIQDDNAAKLEIGRFSEATPNSYIKLGANSASLRFTNAANSTDLVTIENGGDVGIGTNTPEQKLHVQSTSDLLTRYQAHSSSHGVQFQTWHGNSQTMTINSNTTNPFAVYLGSSGGTNTLSVSSGGNVTVGAGNLVIGTAGKGIDFTAETPSEGGGGGVASSILDDYEEGNWVPTVEGSTGSPNISSFLNRGGQYVKIGRQVMVTCRIQIAAGSYSGGSGSLQISGLPFSVHVDSDETGGSIGLALGFDVVPQALQADSASNKVFVMATNANGTITDLVFTYLYFNLNYLTDT